jgi:hypothetical protein
MSKLPETSIRYHATPARRCGCPSKQFDDAKPALTYAENAARVFAVAYGVWEVYASGR